MKFASRISAKSFSALKKYVASVFIFGSWVNVQSQVITSDITTACPGEAIEFTQAGFSATAIEWQRWNGVSWVKDDVIKSTSKFVIDMGNSDLKIRAVAGSQVSNEITIKKSNECKNSCILSSSGDYITGTDFDRKNPSQTKPAVPEGVESYFSDYEVGFTNNNGDYKVTQDLGSTFNGQYPILDNGKKENSYYVFTSNPSSSKPFTYEYPCRVFHDQNYRLVMRMYVMKKANCGAPSAQIKLETGHGEQTLDRAVMKIYDNNNQLIKQDEVLKTYGSVNLNIDNKYAGQLLRIDFTFYGYFPGGRDYHPNSGDFNGLKYYTMTPLFQQFDNCYTVAIDYLSAEVENVCLSPQMVCAGTTATTVAYATGFDSEAEYKWEIKNEKGEWEPVAMKAFDGKGDEHRKAIIPVTRTGKIYGRVIVKSRGFMKDGTVQEFTREKEFTVTGKDCDPIYPDKISGADLICTPNSTSVYTLDPIDDDPTVFFRWTLRTPTGRIINSTVYEGTGEGMQAVNIKGSSVRLILPALSEHGNYTLTAQTIQRIDNGDGSYTDTPKGSPITKTIKVHNTPSPKLTLTGYSSSGSSEKDKTLCPADITTSVLANVDVTNKSSDHKYNYTWTGATSTSKTSTSATVTWDRSAACSGTLSSHTISVKAEIDGIGCPATVSQTYKFEKPVDPTIDCSKIDGSIYELGEKERTKNIDLPLPSYTASCDPDPKMTIDVVVKDFDGKVLTGTNQTRTITFAMSQSSLINKRVVAPVGTVEVTYSITDGCGKTEKCSAEITVKDVTPPNINCSNIKSYTAHLKNQSGCVAIPGDYASELPTISQPKLVDLNGVDGTITGEYMGRVEQESEPSTSNTKIFSKTKDYNDAYKKGVTWILWKFSDKSENSKYCLQKITVIDDKNPNVTCPNVDLGILDVDTLTCTLKPSSVIAKLKEVAKLPYGFDECSKTPEDSLVPTLYYRIPKEGDDLYEIKDDQLEDPIFETGIKYELVWVFKKIAGAYVDTDVAIECAVPFQAEDQDAPEFDCSTLSDIMVYPNFITTTTDIIYDEYASGMGQTTDDPSKTYTLAKYFEEGYLSMHEDVQDVCGGEVTINITITAPNGKVTTIKNLTEFKKYKFEGDPAGKDARAYTITYKFTDQRFNSKTCEQTVTVVRNAPPIPDCNTSTVVLSKNEDCKALYSLTLDDIPTAEVTYYYALRYGNCEGGVGPAGPGPGAINDCSKMTPKTKKDGPAGGVLKFEEIGELSRSKSGFRKLNVYPDSVRLYDANGNIITVKNPMDSKVDTVITKSATFRTWINGAQCECKSNAIYGHATANKTNFKTLPSIVDDYDLPVGINKYVWYFSNAYEKEDPTSKVLVDSCVIPVEVVDTIAPTLTCGPWEGTSKYYADQSCELSQAQVKVVVPTLEQLKAKDNCTAIEDLKLSWVRIFNKKRTTDLSAPYKVGETTINWIVTDESGNSDTCTQYIQVIDTLGPPVDCDVVTPPLTAYVDATCKADADVVIEAGLQIPEIDDDPCSPIGGRIKGVGVRSDNEDVMKAPYPKGITTITWTFTDAAGASSVCNQTITVLDSMKPVFDCREILDTTIALDAEQCELNLEQVLAALGSHKAVDNCDGDIQGVPMLRDVDDVKEIKLKEPFKSLRKDTTYHFVWHFVDKSGNDKTCDQYMTIADTTPPDASDACKNLVDMNVVAVDCKLPFSKLNVNLNSTINDLCDGEIKAKVQAYVTQFDGTVDRFDDDEILSVEFPVGTHKFLYIYTDNAGLSDTCVMYRTVIDKSKPVILDCFDGKDTVMGNVSSDVCGMTYEDLKDLIIIPKSYDECDMLANDGSIEFIDPTVKRYFLNIDTKKYELTVDGDAEEWKVDPFLVGLTKLVFTFTDKSGNSDSCVKYVNVVDARGPSFDCSTIDPNPYYPIADPGECSVIIGDIWDILNGDYVATRSCTDEKIPGILTLYGTDKRVPADYVLEVGRDYHLTWVFRSEIDGKVATCDQIIRPNHQNPLVANCDNAADIDTIKATAGKCEIPGDSVITKYPYGIDACTSDTIWGVPHRSDGLEISDPFPTGSTHISWTMVSPYNVEDTARCEQDVNIKGNRDFELNCDELTPAMHKIVAGCDSTYLGDTLTVPLADDPCANPDSSYFKRPGEGVRSDDASLDPIKDKYPLGPTMIKWIFWDFTHSVKDSCDQLVDVRTTETLKVDCDSINNDTINIPVETGLCSIEASQVKDSLLKRGYPVALHPCGLGEFIGTPTRPNGLTMDDPFYVGPNEIIWVFIDSTTHTLVDSVVKCTQIVRVGDVNEPPVDCSQMPDTLIVLDPFDCDIDFTELGFNIKPVYDLCSKAHIDSVVTRASLPGYSSEFGDDILSYPFNVGVDTVYWRYNFGSYNYLCTQVINVKDSMEPVVDCDTILDEEIVLPENLCEIPREQVLDSIKQPFAYEYCTNLEIKGIPNLMTISESGDTTYSELPSKFKVGEPIYISWLFKNDSLTVLAKRCDIELTIKSSTKPIFDCSVFKDTIKKSAEGECDVVLDDKILPIQEGEDACVKDYVVYGKAYQVDTLDGKPTYKLLAEMSEEGTPSYKLEKLKVGVYNIAWVFESKYSTATDTCNEVLNILTDKRIDIACVELPSFPPTSNDSCSISVALDVPVAVNPCTNEVILPDTVFRSDKVPFKGVDDTFYVGVTTVYWVYIDHSKTLKDSIDTCSQIVQVGDIKDPVIKCPKDTLVTLPIAVCQLDPEDILLNDSLPYFRDYCADTIVPLLKVWRASGKKITEKFELGIDTVFRKYIYHGVEYICEQQIKVRNAGIDSFNCDLLGKSKNDTITIELKTASNTVPFSEVEKKGFVIPDLTLLNACGQLDTTFTRSDNLKLKDPYPLGVTTITMVVKDTTPGSNETKTCIRIINVINTGAPGMNCPELGDAKYICHNDLPASYKTFEEFIAAGGKFLAQDGTSAPELVDQSTFKVDSVIYDVTNTKVSTVNLCEYTLIRTYSAIDLRKQNVSPCSDTFHVKDDVPPVWIGDATSTIDTFVCTPTTPFVNSNIKAKDNCWDVEYDTPVDAYTNSNRKSGIFYWDYSNRSDDPSKCEYYNYDVERTFVAFDACDNHSDTIRYLRVIRDTIPPIINVPEWFDTLTIPANYGRPCIFLVPDVDGMLPPDIATDNCDPNASRYFKHTQIPPKGDTLHTEAGYVDVKIIIEDPCGLKDSIVKRVIVPTRKSIVDLSMKDTTICAEDHLLVMNENIMWYTGKIWEENLFEDNVWDYVDTKSVAFDYYKDTLLYDNLIFSDNSSSYKWMFTQTNVADYLRLDSYSRTGKYIVVATDTVRFCRDTASAFINVHEAPYVHMASEYYSMCEDDSLPLISGEVKLYDRFDVYTFDNGEEITEEGWVINGQVYEPQTKLPYSDVPFTLRYYAKNFCGTTTSIDGISIETQAKMRPENLMLVTNPQNPSRVFRNENAELKLVTKYKPYEYHWYKVNGSFDGRFGETFDKEGVIKEEFQHLISEQDSLLEITYSDEEFHDKYDLLNLQDTASYYVLMIDSVCPAVPSNVVSINVVKDIPTAFTPMNSVGLNDTFMKGYPVIIFNRYGQKMVEGHDGWDGKLRGEYVDPGVYFYEVILKDNSKYKGTIEVVYFK